MKTKNILLITLMLINYVVFSQNMFHKKITVKARYIKNKGVEMRIIPEDKVVFMQGCANGFIVERTEQNNDNYKEIARTKALSIKEWEELYNSTKDEKEKEDIDFIRVFYGSLMEGTTDESLKGKNLESVLAEKDKQDYNFMALIFLSIKNNIAMKALGLSYFDKTVEKNMTYKYRVRLVRESNFFTVESVPASLKTIVEKLEYLKKFNVIKEDKKLRFNWVYDDNLFGYEIERSDYKKNKFMKINDGPIVNMHKIGVKNDSIVGFVDEGLTNYKKYTYRFYAYNIFNERVLLNELTSFSIDLTPPPMPSIISVEHVKPNEIHINWKLDNVPDDFKGFYVARANSKKAIYKKLNKKLLSVDKTSYIDTTFSNDFNSFYTVKAIDTAGNVSSAPSKMVILIDTIAPRKPIISSIIIDSTGITKIIVQRNVAKDLMGYKLFRANSQTHEFSAIKDFFVKNDSIRMPVQTTFTDTISLKTLTKNVFYRVKALDFHFNQSEFSEIYTVKRPDIVPPTAPVIKGVRTFEDKIELSFVLSNSRDVEEQYLYRKLSTEHDWKQIAIFKKGQNLYTDKNVEVGKTYQYTMRAMDESGLWSEYAVAVFGEPVEKGLIPVVQGLSVKQNRKYVKIKWKYPNRTKDIFFVVYKQTPNGKMQEYKRTSKNYIEDGLKSKGTYRYAVKVYSNDGKQSMLSNFKEVSL